VRLEEVVLEGGRIMYADVLTAEEDKDRLGDDWGPVDNFKRDPDGPVMICTHSPYDMLANHIDRYHPKNEGHAEEDRRGWRPSWTGGTIQDVLDRRNGWPEGVEKITRDIAQIIPEGVQARRPRPTWREEGHELSMDRLREGHERCWLGRSQRPGERVIDIMMRLGENSNASQESLYFRGAAVVAAVDTLEELGYRVNLTSIQCTTGMIGDSYSPHYNTMLIDKVEVKQAHDPVDMDFLATTMASPLFFRGNLFAHWRCLPWMVGSGLGASTNLPRHVLHGKYMVEYLPDDQETAKELYSKILAAVQSNELGVI